MKQKKKHTKRKRSWSRKKRKNTQRTSEATEWRQQEWTISWQYQLWSCRLTAQLKQHLSTRKKREWMRARDKWKDNWSEVELMNEIIFHFLSCQPSLSYCANNHIQCVLFESSPQILTQILARCLMHAPLTVNLAIKFENSLDSSAVKLILWRTTSHISIWAVLTVCQCSSLFSHSFITNIKCELRKKAESDVFPI